MEFMSELILKLAPALNWVIVISCFGLWGKHFLNDLLIDEKDKREEKIRGKNWKILGKR